MQMKLFYIYPLIPLLLPSGGQASHDAPAVEVHKARPSLSETIRAFDVIPLSNELDCLAKTVYFEARNQSVEGQMKVAQVVRERIKSKLYPNQICDVVNQPRQFKHDGIIHNIKAYNLAYKIAFLSERWRGDGSTHFYSGPVPFWAKEMEEKTIVGDHTFMKEIR